MKAIRTDDGALEIIFAGFFLRSDDQRLFISESVMDMERIIDVPWPQVQSIARGRIQRRESEVPTLFIGLTGARSRDFGAWLDDDRRSDVLELLLEELETRTYLLVDEKDGFGCVQCEALIYPGEIACGTCGRSLRFQFTLSSMLLFTLALGACMSLIVAAREVHDDWMALAIAVSGPVMALVAVLLLRRERARSFRRKRAMNSERG